MVDIIANEEALIFDFQSVTTPGPGGKITGLEAVMQVNNQNLTLTFTLSFLAVASSLSMLLKFHYTCNGNFSTVYTIGVSAMPCISILPTLFSLLFSFFFSSILFS